MHKNVKARRIVDKSGTDAKEIVVGMVERDGKVRAFRVEKRSKPVLQKRIREEVEAGAAIFTDELKSCDGLDKDFRHEVINHAVEYVRGNVHANCAENFWSLNVACTAPTSAWNLITCSVTSTNRLSATTTASIRTVK